MKSTIITTAIIIAAGTAIEPAFLPLLAIGMLVAAPIATAIALPWHAMTMRRIRRKRGRDFAHAYDAWKRAEKDPHGDAGHMLTVAECALYRLREVKP
jgi:hypothetical protein